MIAKKKCVWLRSQWSWWSIKSISIEFCYFYFILKLPVNNCELLTFLKQSIHCQSVKFEKNLRYFTLWVWSRTFAIYINLIISILKSLVIPAFWLVPKNRSSAVIALFESAIALFRTTSHNWQSRKSSNRQSQHSKDGCTTCENFEKNFENFHMSLLQNTENTNDKDLNKITYICTVFIAWFLPKCRRWNFRLFWSWPCLFHSLDSVFELR